ncbi:MAG: hypothetical protein Q8O89_04265 [Nanoarchaeota archaeon]|nr:hypothetical protein [Nanoarchaeota archaeon]
MRRNNMSATTIQVKQETLAKLKYFKQFEKESYDEIISKLIEVVEEGELREESIKGIGRGLIDVKEGRTKSINDLAKEMNIKL